MNGSIKVLPTHLQRQAVVYLRQSDPKQVRQNRESAINQRALTERLRELTWKPEQIIVVDGDQGTSAKHAEGREGFQKLVADVGLGKIGIILGYEVSRLARNNADWHRLLELCALFNTLIGDSDGIYTTNLKDREVFNDVFVRMALRSCRVACCDCRQGGTAGLSSRVVEGQKG